MKIRTMNRNNLKEPRHEAFNYNTIALPFVGFFNEITKYLLGFMKLPDNTPVN